MIRNLPTYELKVTFFYFSNDGMGLIRTLLGITKGNKQIYYKKWFLRLGAIRGCSHNMEMIEPELHGTLMQDNFKKQRFMNKNENR